MNRIYRFAEHELHSDPLVLTLRGKPVEATSQALMLLHYLVQHPGEVIEKSRLLTEVWGHAHLTDAAFARAILRARQVVNDDGRAQRIIRTVHGRGVMLVADVVVEDVSTRTEPDPGLPSARPAANSGTPASRRAWLSAAVIVLLVATGAVLLGRAGPVPVSGTASTAEQTLVLRNVTLQGDDPELEELRASLPTMIESVLGVAGIRVLLNEADAAESENAEWLGAGDKLPDYFGAEGVLDLAVRRDGLQVAIDYKLGGRAASKGTVLAADRSLAMRKLMTALRSQLSGLGDQRLQALNWLEDPLLADLVLRGSSAWASGDTTAAIQAFDAALSIAPDDPLLQLARLEARAETDLTPSSASAQLKSWAGRNAESISPLVRARALERAGTHAWYAGAPMEAVNLLTEALGLVKSLEAPFTTAVIRNALSMAQQSAGDQRAAWENGRLSADALRAGGFRYHLSMALTNLGYLEEDRGRIAAASALHREALAIREQFGFRRLIGSSTYAVARIARRSGQLDEALELIDRAHALFGEIKQFYEQIDALEEKAEIQMRLGRFTQAHATLDIASQRAIELDDPLAQAWIDDVRGRLVLAEGRGTEAVGLLKQSIEQQQSLGEESEARYSQIALVGALAASGSNDDARMLSRQLGTLIDSLTHDQRIALAMADLLVARSSGDHAAAGAACDRALDLARISGASDREAEAAIECGRLYLDDNRIEQARNMLQLASSWNADFVALQSLQHGLRDP